MGFQWTARPSAPTAPGCELCVGQVTSADASELAERLTRLGSRLVFLIDWNRARKRLGRFLKKSDAIAVLTWAADHNVGHRAFLQLGDVRLVYTAMERAARAQIRYGARLDEILGRESAQTFLQAVLRIAADGLREHKSVRLVQDEIQAELLTHFQSSEQGALNLAMEHAMLIAGLAELVRDALARVRERAGPSAILRIRRSRQGVGDTCGRPRPSIANRARAGEHADGGVVPAPDRSRRCRRRTRGSRLSVDAGSRRTTPAGPGRLAGSGGFDHARRPGVCQDPGMCRGAPLRQPRRSRRVSRRGRSR